MAQTGRSSVHDVTAQMNEISANTSELNTRVQDLDDNTAAIVSAVNVIKSIKDTDQFTSDQCFY